MRNYATAKTNLSATSVPSDLKLEKTFVKRQLKRTLVNAEQRYCQNVEVEWTFVMRLLKRA